MNEEKYSHLLDQAISEIRQGRSVSEVLSHSDLQSSDIAEFIVIAKHLNSLRKLHSPTPHKRYAYLKENLYQPVWKTWLSWSKLFSLPAIALGSFLIIVGGSLIVSAAEQSLPGNRLFSVKKGIEQTNLIFTPETEKPQAKLALVEKRLAEATEVLSSPAQNQKATQAALVELSSLTTETISEVKKTAETKDLGTAEVNILNSLVEITKKQEALASTIAPQQKDLDQDTVTTAQNIVTETKLAAKTIQKLIATVNEKALANLITDPNEFTLSGGIVNSIDKTKLNVEKINFIIDSKTIVTQKDGQVTNLNNITIKSKVTVIGTKLENGTIAKKIIILETPDNPGTVKGETTTKPSVTPIKKPIEEPTPSPEPVPPVVTGTFIPEDPSPSSNN